MRADRVDAAAVDDDDAVGVAHRCQTMRDDERGAPAQKPNEHAEEHAHTSARMNWARLLKRVFDLDLEHCPQCGGDLKIIAAPSTGSGQALKSLR